MPRSDLLKASPPMFKSPWLDRFTRVHPAIPVIIFLPAIVVLFVLGVERAGFWNSVALVMGGYAVWTLTEYWLHRVVFHFEPEKGIGARLHWMIHGVHHDHPNDPMRLVMPPSASIPLALLFAGLFWLVLGGQWFMPFLSGFLAGYLAYDMIHYHVHHHRPRTRVGRRLRELHMRHHFQDDERGFGVSAPYWDHVFGTPPEKRAR
ncbi:MAG TPA: sterol desaturase family protein [Solirubrobacteraceae bacterium]|nr:sterol desaturase family protein [Solirubrobacteraceae bacterium]